MNINEQVYIDRRDVLLFEFKEATNTGKGVKSVCKRLIRLAEDIIKDKTIKKEDKADAHLLKSIITEYLKGMK